MLIIKKNLLMLLSGLVFAFAGFLHGVRAGYGWELVVGPWIVPLWVSWTAALVLLVLSYNMLKNMR